MRTSEIRGPGIYKIVCLMSKKVYVGSTRDLRRRSRAHRDMLNGNRHCNIHLQAAWNKYGHKMFRFEVLEECPVEHLTGREQFWLDETDAYKTGYNRCLLAYRLVLSPESRAKMSRTKKGKKLTPEHKAKLSVVGKGRPLSPEHKEKCKTCHWSKGPRAAEIGARIAATRLAKGLGCTPEMAAKISETKLRQAAEKRAARNQETSQES